MQVGVDIDAKRPSECKDQHILPVLVLVDYGKKTVEAIEHVVLTAVSGTAPIRRQLIGKLRHTKAATTSKPPVAVDLCTTRSRITGTLPLLGSRMKYSIENKIESRMKSRIERREGKSLLSQSFNFSTGLKGRRPSPRQLLWAGSWLLQTVFGE